MAFKHFQSIAITGASRGLGAALAVEFARQFAKGTPKDQCLVLHLSGRQMDKLSKVAAQSRAYGADVYVTALDVTDRGACGRWIEDISARGAGLDLVIANAGISGGTGGVSAQKTVLAESLEAADQIFAVNWQGVLNTIHPATELIAKTARPDRRGHVAVLSSIAGFRGMPGAPAYCASKAAVKIYGESLRANLESHHIDVSVICPGFVKSDMTDANDFKMPFLMEADRAAKIMVRGLRKGKGRIAFPLPLLFGAWLMNTLPDGLVHRLTKNTPLKPPLTED